MAAAGRGEDAASVDRRRTIGGHGAPIARFRRRMVETKRRPYKASVEIASRRRRPPR
jgi:hypothetical protein